MRRLHELQSNPLDLVLREAIFGAIIELGRPRAFMRSHRLRVLKRTTVAEIGRDPGRTESVVADRRMNAGRRCAPADHDPCSRLIHRFLGEDGGVVSWAGTK